MRRFLWIALAVVACEPPPFDSLPPRLLSSQVAADGTVVELTFDEPLARAEVRVDEADTTAVSVEGPLVKVPLPPGLRAGSGHVWAAEVTDPQNNLTTVAGKFHAANQRPALLRLNEVRIAGSGTHTDFVELRVEVPGSLGGWAIEVWSGPESRQRLVLPDEEVPLGAFVVIRYKEPQESTDSAQGAIEFWQTDGKGISGTKGLILLKERADGEAREGLLYAKKAGEAAALAKAAGWTDRTEHDPSGCTATRTWCRTDEGGDWLITANGGSTPGGPNKLKAWAGPPSTRGGTPKTTP